MSQVTNNEIVWRFGGLFTGTDPYVPWLVFGGLALLGLVLICVSYRASLVKLSPAKRMTLCTLRFLLLLLILALLAEPVRIFRTRSRPQTEKARALAVLVDQSDSMKTADNRGRRRADDAHRRWAAIDPAARKAFSELRTYAFGAGVERIPDLDSPSTVGKTQTELFATFQQVLTEAPPGGWGGIVTLTDGLDTSGNATGDREDVTVRAALASSTPLYFVPGRNRQEGKPFIKLRDWNMPARTAPLSTIQLEVTIDSFQRAACAVPVSLRIGNVQRPVEMLRVEPGRRMLIWKAELTAEAVGELPVELRLGEGPQSSVAKTVVRVEAPTGSRILFFQGALDWGYKFLTDILKDDPDFSITPILALSPEGKTNTALSFPTSATGLAAYDIVILSNAEAQQFSDEQQEALTAWVRNGGVLLFLAPDDATAQGYVGSELEKMLPVVFGGGNKTPQQTEQMERRTLGFRFINRRLAGRGGTQTIQLFEFSWEPAARQIFGEGEIASPRFSGYAHVLRAKPAAEVLARHPRDLSPDEGASGKAILLALQTYGRGKSAVLTSDALWRWKLSQPSEDASVEKFWRQLLSWLSRNRSHSLAFEHPLLTANVGQEVVLRLTGVGALPVRVEAKAGPWPPETLDCLTTEGGTNVYRWRPQRVGDWEISATDQGGRSTRHWMRVQDNSAESGENSGLPTNEPLMEKLAERTGGAVLRDTAPEQWVSQKGPQTPEIVSERRGELWHHSYVLAALIICLATELLLRRRWFLL